MADEAKWRIDREMTGRQHAEGGSCTVGELVLVQAEGRRPPLFVIHDSALPMRPQLLEALRSSQLARPVYALSLEPADSVSGYRSIHGLAAAILARVQSIQSKGPYSVLGLRTAGLVAYELCLLLLGRDESVELLGLVDTDCRMSGECRVIASASAPARDALAAMAREYHLPESELVVHLFSSAPALASGPGVVTRGWDAKLAAGQLRVVPISRPAIADAVIDARNMLEIDAAFSNLSLVSKSPSFSPSDRSAILLQQGGPEARLLFCVPGAGAGVTDFLGLAAALGSGCQVHAFQTRGMDGKRTPHSSVEAAARTHLADLRRLCPRGEIHLVGHSFGGWVALEMALQLRAEGRTVGSLTLLDSTCPREVSPDLTRAEALVRLGELYELAAQRPLGITLGALCRRDAVEQVAYLHASLVRGGLIPARSSALSLLGPVRAFEAAIRTGYRPRAAFDGRTDLVLATRAGESEAAARLRMDSVATAWRRYAPSLRLKLAGGNHVTMLESPHVDRLAGVLRESWSQSSAPVVCARVELSGTAHSH